MRQGPTDEAGKVYGYLTVIERAGSKMYRGVYKKALWLCRCTCGEEVIVAGQKLREGCHKACARGGHYWRENRGTGFSHLSEYRSWEHMQRRCAGRDAKDKRNYKDRGIKVCERWLSFGSFYADMGRKPDPSYTIERIDNDGDYEPGNCRWATAREQTRNMRRSVYVDFRGERKLLLDLCRERGVKLSVVYARLKMGWGISRALNVPVRPYRRKAD